ncbi:hypothetical protein [Streptomyces alfalfae]|uniref:Uncharacterized protein n=1 Tax=Streptomyces alfalfae TaxID=1642299 RepID=A0A7T4PBT3_9ACTN|nr:hypothetical protein [Streptomyces alfalfae]QQC87351.1 hypothetical protein I8755_02205 [Streptomyces alfalfae]
MQRNSPQGPARPATFGTATRHGAWLHGAGLLAVHGGAVLVGVVFGSAATVPADSPVTVTDPVAPLRSSSTRQASCVAIPKTRRSCSMS